MIPSRSHGVLGRRQLDIDPLTQIFMTFAPEGQDNCWVPTTLKVQQHIAAKRAYLLTQLNGQNFKYFRKTFANCGNKRCLNPWHAYRAGPKQPAQPIPIQYPEIADRERLLLWYAAGNSPIRAVDVDDVKAIMESTPDLVRSYAGSSPVSSGTQARVRTRRTR